MDCSEEVVILERRLKPLTGLEAVSADLFGQRLHVKYDAAKLTTAAMVDAVGQTGMRMWLEHEEPTVAGADIEWRWRLMLACAAATAMGLALSTSGRADIAPFVFTLAAVAGAVFPARRALAAIRSRTLDINSLMVIAVAGALVLGEWFEAASVVLLFAIAQWLEVRTMERARQAIRALIELSPREALIRRNGVEQRLPVESIRRGDEMLVRPGEKIPLDGVVVAGHGDVNEAPLTGESLPVDKAPESEVYAGTINGRGALDVRVTRLVGDTRLARVIHLVETAQASRAPVQAFVDRFARLYTPAVLVLAGVIAVVPLIGGGDPGTWVYRALVLLVISCPCALVISTPVSLVSALSAAARNGVLIKGGVFLERLAAVRVAAFDKTGTLTTGHPVVVDVIPAGPHTSEELLRLAAAVESRSEHPVGRAILTAASHRHAGIPAVTRFRALPGLGAEGEVEGMQVVVGNERLLASQSVALDPVAGDEKDSTVYVAVDGAFAGSIRLRDRARETAREAIGLLREQGVTRVAMLTGDVTRVAAQIGREVGVDEVRGELLPEQKHSAVRELAGSGPVMMVGDGINDAPALAAAHVGVAMGAAGSDAALETADVALMSDELLRLPYALRLARATMWNVRVNMTISLALKAAFLAMAVTGSATLWMAVLADTGASVIVVGNALRLLRAR
jgi:Cd2+/Zn2+-exporting ATPase